MISLATMVLGKLVDRAADTALDRLIPTVDRVREDRDQLLDGQQRQLSAPLKSALNHLEMGRIEQARDLLIEAEALEPHAPAVKLLLAATLARGGVSGIPVTRRLDEAFAMNPFLVPKEVELVGYDEFETNGLWSRDLNALRWGRSV